MEKQNILFIMNNLGVGGAEKALISLLETIDYQYYHVDLFLFKHEGIFLSRIPKQVNLLKEPSNFSYFDMPLKTAIMKCMKQVNLKTTIQRMKAGVIFKTDKNPARCEQRVWKYLCKSLDKIDKKYDVAIGYLEKNPIYFCVDKVMADKKIGFIHNDYKKLKMDPKIDDVYFEKLNRVVTVSTECANVLKEVFPRYKHKVEVMHNIVSPNLICNLALADTELKDNDINLVSVGRLTHQKGFDMAIQACRKLVESNYNITWYVIGEGEGRDKLVELISYHGLQNHFILTGLKENPYPYIKNADIYIQPSRFEGKSIAIDEAKIMHKPIVVTNFSTAKDQIKHKETGFITDMNAKSIASGIIELIEDYDLREGLVENLKQEKLGTESEIHKFYSFIRAG